MSDDMNNSTTFGNEEFIFKKINLFNFPFVIHWIYTTDALAGIFLQKAFLHIYATSVTWMKWSMNSAPTIKPFQVFLCLAST